MSVEVVALAVRGDALLARLGLVLLSSVRAGAAAAARRAGVDAWGC